MSGSTDATAQDKQFPIMLQGSRYAERIPIGKPEIIDNFPHETLRKFYGDWYRPDLMSVVAVGDFEPVAIEKMIQDHFSRIPAARGKPVRASYPVPDHPGTLYAIATDKEATSASISIYAKMEPRDQKTVGAYRRDLVERLFSSMLGTRFSELAQKPDAPFLGAGGSRGSFVRSKEVSTLSAGVKGNAIEQTLEVMFTEAERVARHGFTPGEFERTKTNITAGIERAVREKENTPAASVAGQLVNHVTNGEPVPGIECEAALTRRFLPEITLAEVNALAKDWVPDRNRVVVISAPEKAEVTVPTEQQLAGVISAVGGKSIPAYVDTVDAAPLLDPLPKPGAIAKTTTLEKFGITEWQLANGVKVVVKPTDFREDEIVMRAVSYGGMSQAADADYVPASSATAVVNAGGLGRFSLVDFRKKMTGKQTSVSPFINQYEEGLSGTSTRKDLETMFQLIYLRFLQPRMDPTAFATFQGTMRSQLANQRNNPAFLFNEALTGALRNNHLRTRPITLEMVDQLNLEKSMAFYKDRFADASDFTFVFAGSIDLEAMKALVERYLGALPSTRRKESWKDTGIRYATGVVEKRVEKGLEPQSRAALVFSGAYKDSQEQRIALRALADVLNARLREKLREDLGGTYGASVGASYTRIPVGEYAVTINFSCDPARTEELIKATFADIEDLKTNGPLEKQVNDTREKLIRDNETSVKQNAYWMTQLSLRYLSDEPLDTLFEMPEHYKKLTVASVHDAAKRYLNPANVVKVTMYPEKKSN